MDSLESIVVSHLMKMHKELYQDIQTCESHYKTETLVELFKTIANVLGSIADSRTENKKFQNNDRILRNN